MKKYILFLSLLSVLACTKEIPENQCVQCTTDTTGVNNIHYLAPKLQALMDEYTAKGIPGVAVAIKDSNGFWHGTAGYAKLETSCKMLPCHLQYGQSVAKLYCAVLTMKLKEAGKIDLDKPIKDYLSQDIYELLPEGSDKITVRMLMSHTSGLPDYAFSPKYFADGFNYEKDYYSIHDMLSYIKGQDLIFEPGAKYVYINTNYVVLASLLDQITGSHEKALYDQIFQPYGLNHTFYPGGYQGHISRPELPNSYIDRFGNGQLENITDLQVDNVNWMRGDDGIIATPRDYISFLEKLMKGEILSPASMAEMKQFNYSQSNPKSGYGLGLGRVLTTGDVEMLGHSGGGIGAGCVLYYIPSKKLTYFVGVNYGTLLEGPISTVTTEFRDKVRAELVK